MTDDGARRRPLIDDELDVSTMFINGGADAGAFMEAGVCGEEWSGRRGTGARSWQPAGGRKRATARGLARNYLGIVVLAALTSTASSQLTPIIER